MGQIISGDLISGGVAINVPCGFVPDMVILFNKTASTGDIFMHMKLPGMPDGDSAAFVGVADSGSTGNVSVKFETTNGPADYNAVKIQGRNWAASTAYVVGDVVRPATKNGYAYECTVAGTSHTSAPTWPTTLDETVADNSVTWKCVVDTCEAAGFQGFTIPAAFSDDNDELFYVAFETDMHTSHGDVG